MTNIGEIGYNKVGDAFYEVYPALRYGPMSFNFTHNKKNYIIKIFYNMQAECLFYSIIDEGQNIIQSQSMLVEYPTDLATSMDFRNMHIYMKDYLLYYTEDDDEVL